MIFDKTIRFCVSVPVLSTHKTVAAAQHFDSRYPACQDMFLCHAPCTEAEENRQNQREFSRHDTHRQRQTGQNAIQPVMTGYAVPDNQKTDECGAGGGHDLDGMARFRLNPAGFSLLRRKCLADFSQFGSSPIAVTRAMPFPCTTSEPENRKGKSSPPGLLSEEISPVSEACLRTGTDSPVKSDSSTVMFCASSK